MTDSTSEFKSKGGIRRIFNAIGYSIEGFKAAWEHEHAFRQELLAVIIGTVVALGLPISSFQKVFLIAVMLLVLIVELINSAIEAIVDRISLEQHPLSKRAKDIGSAAVMLAIMVAALAWAVVLFNRFW